MHTCVYMSMSHSLITVPSVRHRTAPHASLEYVSYIVVGMPPVNIAGGNERRAYSACTGTAPSKRRLVVVCTALRKYSVLAKLDPSTRGARTAPHRTALRSPSCQPLFVPLKGLDLGNSRFMNIRSVASSDVVRFCLLLPAPLNSPTRERA